MSYTTTKSYKEGIPWQSSGQDLACLVHCQGPGSILGQRADIPQAMWSGQKKKKKKNPDRPWWFSGKESACQWRRHRSDPWYGKIPRWGATKPERHDSWARELQRLSPQALKPVLCYKTSTARQSRALQLETSSLLPQLKSVGQWKLKNSQN